MKKRETATKELQIPLDRFSRKRARGRPPTVRPAEIRGRADNNRFIFNQVWDRLWPRLSRALTDQEVIDSFLEGANPYAQQFVPAQANLILRVLGERKFPKRREAQIGFLADSLAALGECCAAQFPRYLREGKNTRKTHSSHYSVRVLCRMFVWLQRPFQQSCLSEMRSAN